MNLKNHNKIPLKNPLKDFADQAENVVQCNLTDKQICLVKIRENIILEEIVEYLCSFNVSF